MGGRHALETYVDTAVDNATRRTSSITVGIPTDYPTMQAAIDDLTRRGVAQGVTVTLLIEAGHNPASGLLVARGDFGHYTIESEDAVVTVDGSFSGDLIRGDSAIMPHLAALFDMNDLGGDGYAVWNGSVGLVEATFGIRNAGGRGGYINNGRLFARQAEFTGCNDGNVWVTRTSLFDGEEATLTGAKGGPASVTVRRASHANLGDADLSGSTVDTAGLYVIRARAYCSDANISDITGGHGIVAFGGAIVSAGQRSTFTDITNAGDDGVFTDGASFVDLRGGDCSGAGGSGVRAQAASNVNFNGGTADNCGSDGVRATNGSVIDAQNATLTGNSSFDARIFRGGQVMLHSATTSSGTPDASDTNVSSLNEISGSDGIIWG